MFRSFNTVDNVCGNSIYNKPLTGNHLISALVSIFAICFQQQHRYTKMLLMGFQKTPGIYQL